jgi:hypothetical protein
MPPLRVERYLYNTGSEDVPAFGAITRYDEAWTLFHPMALL